MRVPILLLVLFLSLITPTYSIESKVISKEVTYSTLTGTQLINIKNYITNLHPTQSCEFKDGIFLNRIMYNFPPDNVVNMMLVMRMRNLVVPSTFNPYSSYDAFEFVDNLDGTFNVTAPMPMVDLIPSKCSFQESSDPITQVTILDYTCLIELLFVPTHDPANPYLINLLYMSITINGEDESILAFGAETKVVEICPPANCIYKDNIDTEVKMCELDDCTQEKNSTALTYGQDFQMLIEIVDSALKNAFELDIKGVQLKFANQIVDITNECRKLCNDAGLPCKPGYIVVQCPVVHTGSMVMLVTSKISSVNSIGRLLNEEGEVEGEGEVGEPTELIRSSKMLEVCDPANDYDKCIYNNDVPRHEEPFPEPDGDSEPTSPTKEKDENKNLVIGLGVTVALLGCFIIALSLYIYLKKIYKNNQQIPPLQQITDK